jgi:eukaryotic-like serine/threonine-protein kinase
VIVRRNVPPEPEVIAGRYRLDERLRSLPPEGSASSTVHKATDLETGAACVVKLFSDMRWNEESRTLYYLRREPQHPNVVAVHEPPGDPVLTAHLVMDWVDGSSLATLLAARGPLPPEAARGVATQILDAMRVMHAHHISHADLRPAKVLLEHEDPGRVRIIGFGLARALDEVHVPVYVPSVYKRRIPYMPLPPLPPRELDLYSLALVFSEMLTGRRVNGEAARMQRGPPPIPEEVLSGPFGRVIGKATGHAPGEGYKAAEEMLADLA